MRNDYQDAQLIADKLDQDLGRAIETLSPIGYSLLLTYVLEHIERRLNTRLKEINQPPIPSVKGTVH